MQTERIHIELTENPFSIEEVNALVASPAAGGTCVFVGTVRDKTQDKQVLRLEFEAYIPMALSEMRKIADHVVSAWPVVKIAIYHRTGTLQIGDVPVIIAVSAAHRQAAFEACQYCIDTLKQTVPIWKKEIFRDGDVWVAAHP